MYIVCACACKHGMSVCAYVVVDVCVPLCHMSMCSCEYNCVCKHACEPVCICVLCVYEQIHMHMCACV